MKYPEYFDIFANFGTNEMLQEDTLKELESFVYSIFGYKNLSSVNEAEKCKFTSKCDKGKKSLDLCMLPPCQENLKLHMRRANYVATIFNSANLLQMILDSPLKHGWDENLVVVAIVFPDDISDILFAVVGRNEYEDDDESSGNESPEEYLPDSSDSEESDIDYY